MRSDRARLLAVLAVACVAAGALSAAPGLAHGFASLSPAVALLEESAAGCTVGTPEQAQADAAAQAAGCCSGFQCPYAGGVCCGGQAFCCPNGTVCLASGGAVAPQCGTPARNVDPCGCQTCPCAAGQQPERFGVAGGTPAVPNGAAPPEKLSEKKADDFRPGADVGGAIEWKVVRPKNESGDNATSIEKLGPKVKRTNYTVDVQLHVSNFMYTYYIKHSSAVDLKLREDIARNENMAVQSVDIANVIPLRLRTEGTERQEAAVLRWRARRAAAAKKARFAAVRGGDDDDDDDDDDDEAAFVQVTDDADADGAAFLEAAADADDADDDAAAFLEAAADDADDADDDAAAFLEAGFAQVSGLRVDAKIYCATEEHARSLARHIFLTFDKQNPHPFNFKALQGMPAEAHGNAALPFEVLEASKVFLGEIEINDRQGIAVARHARSEAVALKSTIAKADLVTRRLTGQLERERRRMVRVDRRAQRLDALRRRRRRAIAARKRARKRAEEARKAAHKADVLARHEAVQKREASEAGVKAKQKKQREAYQKKHTKKKSTTKKIVWDTDTKPVSYAESVQTCGDGGMRVPQWSFVGDLCVLSGEVCAAKGVPHLRRPLVAVPRACRPAARLIFNRHDSRHRTFRVDGWTSGRLAWNGGYTRATRATLDGIVYPRAGTNKTAPLELGKGWVPYGRSFAAPSVYREDKLCVVTGLARVKEGNARKWGTDRNVIARLPAECRPEGRLVFNLNHHKFTMRLDVLPSGEIEYVEGVKKYKWVSLSGITFFAKGSKASRPLPLLNGYKAFNLGYRKPTVTRVRNLCALSGVVTGSTSVLVTRVPKECRPITGKLSFWTNQGRRSFQIDVHSDGTVRRVPPVVFDSWLSLDGIVYAAGTPQAWEGKQREQAVKRLNKEREAEAAKKAAAKKK